MEVIVHSIENVLLHISRNFTYPNWGRSHQVRISEVLLYQATGVSSGQEAPKTASLSPTVLV